MFTDAGHPDPGEFGTCLVDRPKCFFIHHQEGNDHRPVVLDSGRRSMIASQRKTDGGCKVTLVVRMHRPGDLTIGLDLLISHPLPLPALFCGGDRTLHLTTQEADVGPQLLDLVGHRCVHRQGHKLRHRLEVLVHVERDVPAACLGHERFEEQALVADTTSVLNALLHERIERTPGGEVDVGGHATLGGAQLVFAGEIESGQEDDLGLAHAPGGTEARALGRPQLGDGGDHVELLGKCQSSLGPLRS